MYSDHDWSLGHCVPCVCVCVCVCVKSWRYDYSMIKSTVQFRNRSPDTPGVWCAALSLHALLGVLLFGCWSDFKTRGSHQDSDKMRKDNIITFIPSKIGKINSNTNKNVTSEVKNQPGLLIGDNRKLYCSESTRIWSTIYIYATHTMNQNDSPPGVWGVDDWLKFHSVAWVCEVRCRGRTVAVTNGARLPRDGPHH